jgi:hypothetical protein
LWPRRAGDFQRSLPARGGVLLQLSILAFAATLAATMAANAIDLDELTVVMLARDGSWGVATAGSQGPAIAVAIRHCRAMTVSPSDCGAKFITTRGGWVIANLCGDQKIMVTAETRDAAEQAAINREIDLKQYYGPDLPPCRRILTVDARGGVVIEAARAPGFDEISPELASKAVEPPGLDPR